MKFRNILQIHGIFLNPETFLMFMYFLKYGKIFKNSWRFFEILEHFPKFMKIFWNPGTFYKFMKKITDFFTICRHFLKFMNIFLVC